MKNSIFAAIVSTVLVTASLTVAAQPPLRGGDHGDGFARLEMLADQLGLSEQQEEAINQLLNASQLETAVDRERARQIREELHALADSFDAGQVQLLAEELGAITSRLTYAATAMQAEIRGLFSVEQAAQLEAMKLERAEWSRSSHGSFGPRSGRAPANPSGE